MTCFIAFLAPFGGFAYAGLKRALRRSDLGITLYKGGVIDRIECIVVTGIFMLFYLNMIAYNNQDSESKLDSVLSRVEMLSEEAQIKLYH